MANITAEEYAAKHGIPERTVRYWMQMGRIPTAKEKRRIPILKTVDVLVIPEDAEPPK